VTVTSVANGTVSATRPRALPSASGPPRVTPGEGRRRSADPSAPARNPPTVKRTRPWVSSAKGDVVLRFLHAVGDEGDAVDVLPRPLAKARQAGRVGWRGIAPLQGAPRRLGRVTPTLEPVHPRDELAAQPLERGVFVDPVAAGEQESHDQEPERFRSANSFQRGSKWLATNADPSLRSG
jgi:hypothetical protein